MRITAERKGFAPLFAGRASFLFPFLKGVNMLNVTIHHAGGGTCSLTGKEGDGLAITFDDGTVKNQFLSWKAFRQLLAMKMTTPKPESKIPLALPEGQQRSAGADDAHVP
jgi:hypothetical protein